MLALLCGNVGDRPPPLITHSEGPPELQSRACIAEIARELGEVVTWVIPHPPSYNTLLSLDSKLAR